jgi:4a-hydroxytetrahydrobiopterin dehydratase
MSEQGWKEFVAAEGVDDWAVLHGGATAVFRIRSIGQGAEIALALAGIPGFEGSGAVITLADGSLTVRLTRDMWQLEAEHVELARAVSGVARALGVDADVSATQEIQVAVAAKPDEIDLGFWRAVLGYAPMADDNGVDPLGHSSTVWMQISTRPSRSGTRCTSTSRSHATM